MKCFHVYGVLLILAAGWGCGKGSAPAGGSGAAAPAASQKSPPPSKASVERPPAAPTTAADAAQDEDSVLSDLIQLPDDPDDGDFASRIWQQAMADQLAALEPGRKPRFEAEEIDEGLRFTCNLSGRRHSLVLPGPGIRSAPETGGWFVGDQLVIPELEALDVPKPRSDRESLDKHRDVLLADFKEQGLGLVADTLQRFELQEGSPGIAFELEVVDAEALDEKGVAGYAVAATVRGNTVVLLKSPIGAGQDRAAAVQLLSKVLADSLQWLPDLPPGEAPLTGAYLLQHGLTLAQVLRLRELALMEPYTAWVNPQLASRRDQKVEGVTVLPPERLLQYLRISFSVDQPDLSMLIYDGQSAHAVNLVQFDSQRKRFIYWDPWPKEKGTMLQAGKNRAGIKAEVHEADTKQYSVTEQELQRVFYFVVLPKSVHDKIEATLQALENQDRR